MTRRADGAEAEAAAALLACAALVRFIPYRRWRALVTTRRGGPPPAPEQARRLGRVLDRVVRRLPFHTTCLVRCLALRALLRRRGFEAELRFGVTAPRRGFEAHCWLEGPDGAPLYGAAPGRFVPLRPVEA